MSADPVTQHSPTPVPIADRARAEQADRDRVARFVAEVPRERLRLAEDDPDGEAEAVIDMTPAHPFTGWRANIAPELMSRAELTEVGYTPEQLKVIDRRRADAARESQRLQRERMGEYGLVSNGDGSAHMAPIARDEGLIVDIDDYRAAVPAIVPWICRPIAYTGGVSLIAGAPKSGKSTLMAQFQRCRETGAPLVGQWDVATGPTLLVTEEGGIAVTHKTGDLHSLEILDRRTAVLAGMTFDQVLDVISRWGTDHPGGLVFLDTLSIWAGIEDENSAAETTKAIARVAVVAQVADLAIVLVHHARKSGGDDGEAIRGSGAILATVDIGIELTRVQPGSDQRFLDVMGRVILPERFTLDFDRATMSYSLADLAELRLAAIEDDLEGIPVDGEGLTRSQLHGLWGKDPRKRVEQLLNLGRMRQEYVKKGRGWGWRYWSVPPVWTPSDD